MKLGKKTFLFLFSMMLSMSIIAGFVVYELNRRESLASVGATQLAVTSSALDAIDSLLNEREGDIQVFSRLQQVQEFLLATEDQGKKDRMRSKYKSFMATYGSWENLLVVNASGTVILSPHPEYEGMNILDGTPGEQEVFARALQGNVAHSDALYVPILEKPSVAFAAPIRIEMEESRIAAVIVGYVDWFVVEEILEATHLTARLLDSEGTIIAAHNESGMPLPAFGEIDETLRAQTRGDTDAYVVQDGTILSYAHEVGYLNYQGSNWLLALTRPVKEVTRDAERNGLIIAILFIIGGLLFAGVGILYFQRSIVRPISMLTEASHTMAEGQLDLRIAISSRDEVGTLARAFNDMAGKLKESQENLETKVKERTTELEQKVAELNSLNKFMVNRELKMVELKKEITDLKRQLGIAEPE